ncbi:hypothetical protein Unana1_03685 [Umbelopsis nana]
MVKSDPKAYCHQKNKDNSKNTAGEFGTLGSDCDSPVSLVQSTFDQLKKSTFQDVDFIIYTGDTARHDRDQQLKRTDKDVLLDHKTVLSFFSKTFDLSKTKLIPCIGNNDIFMHDEFNIAQKDTLSKSLLGELGALWKPLKLNLTSTFTSGGYFVQQIPGGPTIISVNSMYFYTKNSDVPDCDTQGSAGAVQMQWLETQLQHAHDSHHKVYIMSHVPPVGKSSILYKPKCYKQYVQLLGQYSGTIASHMTGHTNDDNLAVLYKQDQGFNLVELSKKVHFGFNPSSVVNVLINAPSVLPKNNPGFRVYQYDKTDGTILGWDQYSTDLTQSNQKKSITWRKEYSSSQVYGVKKLDATGWRSVVQKLKTNKKIFSKYQMFIKVEG